jgi:hypothetical protein
LYFDPCVSTKRHRIPMADDTKTSKELQAEFAASFATLLPQAVTIAQACAVCIAFPGAVWRGGVLRLRPFCFSRCRLDSLKMPSICC